LHVSEDSAKAYAHYSIALLEKTEISEPAMESLSTLKAEMTPAEIQGGEREIKKLMSEYGLGG
jgi:hypothetical protein